MTGPLSPALAALAVQWREEADRLRVRYQDEARARMLDLCAGELETALRDDAHRLVTLDEAAELSGFQADSLRKMVTRGELPNAGRKGAPRFRVADLPKKSGAAKPASAYDPDAHARELARRIHPERSHRAAS